MDRLPSLNALRALESTARHLSFVRAADELCVTPAAVKQLVRKLEDTLGLSLIDRSGRGLRLTAAGTAGLNDLSSGFDQLARAVQRMRVEGGQQRLIVSVEPSFATAWLVPRLERFRAAQPDIDVLIDSSALLVDLSRGDADVAIRFGAKNEAPLVTHRLFDEELCAFCSPAIADNLLEPSDLANCSFINWETSAIGWANKTRSWMDWPVWLEHIGAPQVVPRHSLRFRQYNLAVQAAIAGQGIVLGSAPVLSDLVSAGLLVRAVPQSVKTDVGYDLVTMEKTFERQDVKAFFDWIVSEAEGASKKPLR